MNFTPNAHEISSRGLTGLNQISGSGGGGFGGGGGGMGTGLLVVTNGGDTVMTQSSADGLRGARMRPQKFIQQSRLHPDELCHRVVKKSLPNHALTYTISCHKTITLDGLPVGPAYEQLERVLKTLIQNPPGTETEAGAGAGGSPPTPTVPSFVATGRLRTKDSSLEKVVFHNDILRLIIRLGTMVNINEPLGKSKNTALHIAAKLGHLAIVHILFQLGANYCALNADKMTPLMVAVRDKKNDIVHYLLKQGVPTNTRGNEDMTALHVAARHGNLDAIHYMYTMDVSLDLNVQDNGKWTPLAWAADKNDFEAVRYLLERHADPFACDTEGNRPLHWAAYSADSNVTAILLRYAKGTMNLTNNNLDTPLMIAVRRDNHEIVTILINHGCQIPSLDNPRLAEASRDTHCWKLLLSKHEMVKLYSFGPMIKSRVLTNDISLGRERYNIQVVNEVNDGAELPDDFHYITESIEAGDVHVDRNIRFLQSCRCTDGSCHTSSSASSTSTSAVGSLTTSLKLGHECICSSLSYQCWYNEIGLIPAFNQADPPLIFECNTGCSCSMDCVNRTAQRGIRVRLEIFRTAKKGWGVRTLEDIPHGRFVCEYIGEIVDDDEADSRDEDIYLFDLDNKPENDSYCLDAHHYGNVSRFINHSCEPNLFPVKFFANHQDLRFPRIAFFAGRHIEAGSELNFEYGVKFWIVKYKEFTCECGTEKCRYSSATIESTVAQYTAERNTERHLNAIYSRGGESPGPETLIDEQDQDRDVEMSSSDIIISTPSAASLSLSGGRHPQRSSNDNNLTSGYDSDLI